MMKLTMQNRFLSVFTLAVLTLISAPLSSETVKCPEHAAILTASTVNFGVTYNARLEMHKVDPSPGVDGKWRMDLFRIENIYPWPMRMELDFGSQIDLTHGYWIDCQYDVGGNHVISVCRDGNTLFDVVNGRIGSLKTDTWIGKFEGNKVSLKFDANNPLEPTMTGQLVETAAGELSLAITSPENGAQVAFDDATPGELKLTLKATVTPADAAEHVRWEIPELAGSTRTVEPANASGKSVQVTYRGLPNSNASFGKHPLRATLTHGMCEASDQRSVELFFPRDAKNSPDSQVPNWFYYWSQTSAKKGPAVYGGQSGECAQMGDKVDNALGYYAYKELADHYAICDLGKLGSTFPFKTATRSGDIITPHVRVSGIDTFAIASAHENAHYSHFKQWWFQHRANPPKTPPGDMNKNSIKDSAESQYDQDGDLMLDSAEPALGFDPTKRISYPQLGDDDEEVAAFFAETDWQIGSANKEDWAKPGKQWRGN